MTKKQSGCFLEHCVYSYKTAVDNMKGFIMEHRHWLRTIIF